MSSPFTVAGMSSSTSSHHGWGASTSTNTLTGSFGENLSPAKSLYQSGYMSTTQQNIATGSTSQRPDEIPIVPTKAKMSHRGATSDFGLESMFQSTSRPRHSIPDEDAPPTNSIHDTPLDSASAPRFTASKSLFASRPPRSNALTPVNGSSTKPSVYVIVFGYPADKYEATVQYFQSLGQVAEVVEIPDVLNAFKLGFHDPAEAMRSVRKNGELLGGSWFVGVRWADTAQAEALLGSSTSRTQPGTPALIKPTISTSADVDMAVDDLSSPLGTIGTPVRLAPSSSAFRKPGVSEKNLGLSIAAPKSQEAWSAAPSQGTTAPQKGLFGQVTDMIFGW